MTQTYFGLHELWPYRTPLWFYESIQPLYTTLFTSRGNFHTDGVKRLDQIRNASPDTRIILRVWPDDQLSSLMRSPDEWYREFKEYFGFADVLMIENEPSTLNLPELAEWYAEIMDIAGSEGQAVVYGVWSTGEPSNHNKDYHQLIPMWEAANVWANQDIVHVYGPHAYRDPRFDWHRHFLMGRQQFYSRQAVRREGIIIPEMVLTEFGIARATDDKGENLDPEQGVNSFGWAGALYADWLVDEFNWLKERDLAVPFNVFSSGGDMGDKWHSSDVLRLDGFFERVNERKDQFLLDLPIDIPESPPIVIDAPIKHPDFNVQEWLMADFVCDIINVRAAPGLQYNIIGQIQGITPVKFYRNYANLNTGDPAWIPIWLSIDNNLPVKEIAGWIREDVIEIANRKSIDTIEPNNSLLEEVLQVLDDVKASLEKLIGLFNG